MREIIFDVTVRDKLGKLFRTENNLISVFTFRAL